MDERTLLVVNAFFRTQPDAPKLKSLLRARLERDLRLGREEAGLLIESLVSSGVLREITVRCDREGWRESIVELCDDNDSTVVDAVITRRHLR